MAEAFLSQLRPQWQVISAGTQPAERVHPKTIQVMAEVGFDLINAKTKNVQQFLNDSFDYVITVCDHAQETCPVFWGEVKEQVHLGFADPAATIGSEEEILAVFRRVRDDIKKEFTKFVEESH